MLRKLRLGQKNDFLIKKHVVRKASNQQNAISRIRKFWGLGDDDTPDTPVTFMFLGKNPPTLQFFV